MLDRGETGIRASQVTRNGTEKRIAFAELVRVFGEPNSRPSGVVAEVEKPEPPQPPALPELAQRLIDRLEADLLSERERAERYERELAELRKRHDDLVTRYLPPATSGKPGIFGRLFGR